MHAERPHGAKFCVMRPPSPCHGKVALPHVLTGLAAEDVAISHLPRLNVLNGSVDVRAAGLTRALSDLTLALRILKGVERTEGGLLTPK